MRFPLRLAFVVFSALFACQVRAGTVREPGLRSLPAMDLYATDAAYELGGGAVLLPGSGAVVLAQTDLALPGRGGLDLVLTRVYRQGGDDPVLLRETPFPGYCTPLTRPMPGWMYDLPQVTEGYVYFAGRLYPNCLETGRGQDDPSYWFPGCERRGNAVYYNIGGFRLAARRKGEGAEEVVLAAADGVSYVFPRSYNEETGGLRYGPLAEIVDNTGANRITFTYDGTGKTCVIIDSAGREIVLTASGETAGTAPPDPGTPAGGRAGETVAIGIAGGGITVEGRTVLSFAHQEILDPENASLGYLYTIADAAGRTRCVASGRNYLRLVLETGNALDLEFDRIACDKCADQAFRAFPTGGKVNGRELAVIYEFRHDEIPDRGDRSAARFHIKHAISSAVIREGGKSTRMAFSLTELRDRDVLYGLASRLASLDDGRRVSTYTYERRPGADPGAAPANNWFDLPATVRVSQGASAYKRSFSYDENGRLIAAAGPEGTVQYSYCQIETADLYFVGVETEARGPITAAYGYNELGQLVTVRMGSAPPTLYEYDAYGNVAMVTDPEGNTTFIEYDGTHRALPVAAGTKDAAGEWERRTDYEYDYASGRLKKRSTGPYTVEYSYDGLGRIVAVREQSGITTTIYNDSELWAESTDPEGNQTRIYYDRLGRTALVESFTAGGVLLGVTEYAYDPGDDGRLWQVRRNGRLVREIAVDEEANTRTIRDGDGNTLVYHYDLAGRLVKAELSRAAPGEEPCVQTVAYTYDPITGALASVIGPARTITYYYNDRGLVDLVIHSDGRTEEMFYDGNGRLERVKDRSGRWTNYTYNRYGEVTEVRVDGEPAATYVYDDLGRVVSAGTEEVRYGYTYDDAGRLRRGTRSIRGRLYELWYDYDARGRMTGLTLKNKEGAVLAQFRYAHTPEKVAVSALAGGMMSEFAAVEIAEGGVLGSKRLGNGLVQSYVYDERQRLVGSTVTGAGGVMQAHSFSYGAMGEIARINEVTYEFDGCGRLVAATGGLADATYEYNDLGGRRRKTVGGKTTDYIYQDGLLVQVGGTSYNYHPDGSMAMKIAGADHWAYIYDHQGRLTRVMKNGEVAGAYGYDHEGMRVWREEDGMVTVYIREGSDVIYEEDLPAPLDPEAVPSQTRARVFLGGEAAGLVVDGDETYYFINDRLGTTELVTDGRGRLRERIAHMPFAERIQVTAYSYLEQRLGETDDWVDRSNTTASIGGGRAVPGKAPFEVNELLYRNNAPALVAEADYVPAKEFTYCHEDLDVLELKVVTSFKDPRTGEYAEYTDLLDMAGKPPGNYKILLEARRDVGDTAPTENLKFEVYVAKRLQPVAGTLRTKPVQPGDAAFFRFTPVGENLAGITWSISRDDGRTWIEAEPGAMLPVAGADGILLNAEMKIEAGHAPPALTGLDWVFAAESEASRFFRYMGKERDATGLYCFGGSYFDPEVGRFISEEATPKRIPVPRGESHTGYVSRGCAHAIRAGFHPFHHPVDRGLDPAEPGTHGDYPLLLDFQRLQDPGHPEFRLYRGPSGFPGRVVPAPAVDEKGRAG